MRFFQSLVLRRD